MARTIKSTLLSKPLMIILSSKVKHILKNLKHINFTEYEHRQCSTYSQVFATHTCTQTHKVKKTFKKKKEETSGCYQHSFAVP
jgi:hypothetical protein